MVDEVTRCQGQGGGPVEARANRGGPAPVHYSYRYVDHTADVGVALEADSLPALFHGAADSLLHLLLERVPERGTAGDPPSSETIGTADWTAAAPDLSPAGRDAAGQRRLILEAPDLPGLLVRWLNELLYCVQVREEVPVQLRLRVVSAGGALPSGAEEPSCTAPAEPAAGAREPGGQGDGAPGAPSLGIDPGGLAGEGAHQRAHQGRTANPNHGSVASAPGGWKLEAVFSVIPLDPEGMGWQGEIKGATYHGLEVTPVGDPPHRWRARVILDV